MTPPSSRPRLPRRRSPQGAVAVREGAEPAGGRRVSARAVGRGRLSRLAAVLLTAAIALAPQPAAAGTAAVTAEASTAATPGPTPTGPSGVVTTTLAPGDGGFLRPDRGLTATITVDNDTANALPGARASLQMGAEPLADRTALAAWLDGGTGDFALADVGGVQLEAIDADSARSGVLTVTAADPVLAGRGPGVYPLLSTYPTAAGPVVSTSVVTVPPASVEAVLTGIVVPITAGPSTAGLLGARELGVLTASDGDLTAQLDAVAGTPVILAVDPAVVASIRALGTSAPATAVAWLERLDALPNTRFALQFGDADISSQLLSGQTAPQQPTSLSAFLKPADFTAITAGEGATPAPTASPSATTGPILPTLDELVDVGGQAQVFWPATGTAGADVVSVLGAQSTTDAAATTLIASTSTTAGQNGAAVAARGTVGDTPVLVYDAAASTGLRDAARTADGALRGAPLAAAAAYLSFAVDGAAGRSLLVVVDRAADRDGAGLADAIDLVEGTPGTTAATLPQLLSAGETAAVEMAAVQADPERVAAASILFAEEAALQPLSTVVSDPALVRGPARAELLQILGNGWLDRPSEWDAALADHRASTAATLASVEILQPTPVSLASSGAPLGVWIRNDLPYPIDVELLVTPDDPRLTVQRSTPVTVPAESNMRAKVPVESRVGSGEVTLAMELRSAAGQVVGPVRTVDVTVRAEWEGVGIAALSVLVGALVVFGLVRTVLRRRRFRSAE